MHYIANEEKKFVSCNYSLISCRAFYMFRHLKRKAVRHNICLFCHLKDFFHHVITLYFVDKNKYADTIICNIFI